MVEVAGDDAALDRLVRFGAAVGVRIHARGTEEVIARHPVEGVHFHRPETTRARRAAQRLRSARPGIVVSATVRPDQTARQGWADVLCPMTFSRDVTAVERALSSAREASLGAEIWAALEAGDALREQLRAAARAGCEGALLFAYDPGRLELLDIFAAE